MSVSHKDFMFETNDTQPCIICDDDTKWAMDCCQKMICKQCVYRWHKKDMNNSCMHCREILFEKPKCTCKPSTTMISVQIIVIHNHFDIIDLYT